MLLTLESVIATIERAKALQVFDVPKGNNVTHFVSCRPDCQAILRFDKQYGTINIKFIGRPDFEGSFKEMYVIK